VVKDLFDRLGLEFFGVTLTAHTGSYWTGNRRLSTVYKTLGDSKRYLALIHSPQRGVRGAVLKPRHIGCKWGSIWN
jgi:hypothetical protein